MRWPNPSVNSILRPVDWSLSFTAPSAGTCRCFCPNCSAFVVCFIVIISFRVFKEGGVNSRGRRRDKSVVSVAQMFVCVSVCVSARALGVLYPLLSSVPPFAALQQLLTAAPSAAPGLRRAPHPPACRRPPDTRTWTAGNCGPLLHSFPSRFRHNSAVTVYFNWHHCAVFGLSATPVPSPNCLILLHLFVLLLFFKVYWVPPRPSHVDQQLLTLRVKCDLASSVASAAM